MDKKHFWLEKPMNPKLWDDKNKRNEYRKWLEEKFSIDTIQDWLKLRAKDFVDSFQKRHGFSTVAMIRELVPECTLKTWEFRQVPAGWWKNTQNQKEYFDWLKITLGITTPEDWYSITSRQIHPSFIGQFGSFQGMLKLMVPDFNFKPWNFSQVRDGWWKNRNNQQVYMDDLGKELRYEFPEDWYGLRYEDIEVSLMKLFGSPEKLVRSFFPDYKFKTWKFNRVPPGWWDDIKNQQEYIKTLGEELNFAKPEDWYKLRQEHLETRFAAIYKGSPALVAQTFFPHYKFKSWLFESAPRSSWDSYENQKEYMKELGEKLGFSKPEDWYAVGYNDFESAFMRRFGSRHKVLEMFFPDYDFLPWKFNAVENGIWKDRNLRLRYFKWLGEILGYKYPEDWYNIKFRDFKNNYGEVLVGLHYGFSPYKFVQDMIPNYQFDLRRFTRVPAKYWHDIENRKKAIEKLGKILEIENMEDWYNVTAEDFRQNGLSSLLHSRYSNSPEAAIRECFPNYKWESEKFGDELKRQKQVFEIAKVFFGEDNVIWNYKSSALKFKKSGRKIQLDIFVPQFNLALEYQGMQHYKSIKFFGGDKQLAIRQKLDHEKREICFENGILLIEVSYTWKGSKSEIIRLITDALKNKQNK
jgi:hypothetical protein